MQRLNYTGEFRLSHSGKKPGCSRIRMEVLEPRVLYSADPFLAPLIDSIGPTPNDLNPSPEEPFAHQLRELGRVPVTELVIVDISYPELAQLSISLQEQYAGTTTRIVVLNGDSDAIEQITSLLDSHSNLDAIHLLSHGNDGEIKIGGQSVGIEQVRNNAPTIALWGESLTDNGDLLLYGCNLSATPQGQQLASSLSLIMQADVASSDDITGHRDLAGDWDLEIEYGDLETDQLLNSQLQGDWTGSLDIDTSLVARYALNGDSQDSVGTAHATAHNNPFYFAGQIDDAIGFDNGSTPNPAYLSVDAADTPNYNNGGFTLAFWIRLAPGITQSTLVDQTDGNSGFTVAVNSSGQISFKLTQPGDGGITVFSPELVDAFVWNHVTVTYEPDEIKIVINGVEVIHGTGGLTFLDADADLIIGRAVDGSDAFIGDMDDIRFYQRTLTASDIAELNNYTGDPIRANTEESVVVNTGASLANGELLTLDNSMLNTTDAEQSAVELVYSIVAPEPGFSVFLNSVVLNVGETFTQQDINDGFVTIRHDGGTGGTGAMSLEVDDGFGAATAVTFSLIAAPNHVPTDIVLVDTENDSGLSINENGGDAAYLQMLDAGEMFDGLNALTFEISFSTDSSVPTNTTLFDYGTAGNSQLSVELLQPGLVGVTVGGEFWLINDPLVSSLTDTQEHKLSLIWDSLTGATRLYVDGVLVDSATLATGYIFDNSGTATVGNDISAATSASFAGTLHDMRLFEYVRTDARISLDYVDPIGINEVLMPGYWRFDSQTSGGLIGNEFGKQHLSPQQSTHAGAVPGQVFLQNPTVDENAANGTVVATVYGIDPERENLLAHLLATTPNIVYSETAGIFLVRGDGRISWDDAYVAASNMTLNGVNGHMAMPHSAVENTLLINAINDQNLGRTWISANDVATEGEFMFIKPGEADTPISDANGYSVNGAYVNWGAGEPNSNNQFEDAVEMFNHNGQWNDVTGTKNSGNFFFAEFDANEVLNGGVGPYGVQRDLSYSIAAQSVPGAFYVDANTGEIIVADGSLLNHEALNTHTVTITVQDNVGNSYSKDFTIHIGDIDEASVHQHPALNTVVEDTALVFSVVNGNSITIQDVDDNEELTLMLSSSNGLLSLNMNNSPNITTVGSVSNTNVIEVTGTVADLNTALDGLTYQPATNYTGSDQIDIETVRSDLHANPSNVTTTSFINIVVTPVNDDPVAVDDTIELDEGTSASILSNGDSSVLDNDTDPDTAFSVVSQTLPTNGSLILNSDGTFTYTHNGSETTSDFFTYTIEDAVSGATSTARVDITIAPINDAPNPTADIIVVDEDGVISVTDTNETSLLANDTDAEGDSLQIFGVSVAPSNGTVTANPDGSFLYEHDGSETTTDSFTYIAVDEHGATQTAVVDVVITPVNDLPVANSDSITVDEGGATVTQLDSGEFSLLDNDTDAENNGPLAVIVSTAPAHGALVVNPDGTFAYTHDGSETTSDSFTYAVQDSDGGNSKFATVSIVINPTNDAPLAVDDADVVNEQGVITINVLANDNDPDGDNLAVTQVSAPSNGSVVINANNTVTYTHDGSETSADSFSYILEDGNGTFSIAEVDITVMPINDAPVTQADSMTLAEGGTDVVDMLANDADAENDTLSAIILSQPSNGTLVQNPDGSYSYRHDGSETQSDSFTYQAKDPSGELSGVTTVSIVITPVNDSPVAIDDNVNVSESGTVELSVLLNDTDAELDNLTVSITTAPLNGTAFVHPDNTISYTHDGSETLADELTYTVIDGNGGVATAQVSFTVASVNDSPLALDDTDTVAEGGSVTIDVLQNDNDVDSTVLTPAVVGAPSFGTLVLNSDGTFTYTHDGSETANDSFSYVVTDEQGAVSLAADVTLNISPINDAPVANDDTASAMEGTTVTINVHSNDTDAESNGALMATLVSGPTNGSLMSNADGTFTYTHDGSETTADSFSYYTTDVNGAISNNATVGIEITPLNDVPDAVDDSAVLNEAAVININVLANDNDSDGDTLTVALVSGPVNGTAVVNADNTISYSHNGSETLADTLEYATSDGKGGVSTATVSISITPVNDAPVTVPDNLMVNEGSSAVVDVAINDSDAENDALTFSIVSQPSNGSLVQNPDGTFTYTHDGTETQSDSFSYQARDPDLAMSLVTTVAIEVNPVNDIPVAINDAVSVLESDSLDIAVLSNDTDDDLDALSVSIISGASSGSATVNSDNTITYVHDGSETGNDTIEYIVSDGKGGSATAQINITIVGTNDAPIAVDDNNTVDEGGVVIVDVLQNDADAENDVLSTSLVSLPNYGTVISNADGTFTYTHDGSETVNDSFSYIVTDDNGAVSMAAMVLLNINSLNDAPLANDDTATLPEGSVVIINVQSNDIDVDNAALQTVINTNPMHGNAVVNADGTISYTHDGSETTSDSFQYTVFDNAGASSTAEVQLSIVLSNENAPVFLQEPIVYQVVENASNGLLLGTILTSDPDTNDAVQFSLLNNAGGRFQISDNGIVSVLDGSLLDYETNNAHSITVVATDFQGNTASTNVDIQVIDAIEPISEFQLLGPFNVPENDAGSTVQGVVAAMASAESGTISYSLAGQDTASILIDSSTGVLSLASGYASDFEAKAQYSVTVIAIDATGQQISEDIVISVLDVNESPEFTVQELVSAISEDATQGQSVGTLQAVDPDGNTLQYSIVASSSASAFVIDAQTGAITVGNAAQIDFEVLNQHSLQVEVKDPDGLSDVIPVTINIDDVDEVIVEPEPEPTPIIPGPVVPEPTEPEPPTVPPSLGSALQQELPQINLIPIEPVTVSPVLAPLAADSLTTNEQTVSAETIVQSSSEDAVTQALQQSQADQENTTDTSTKFLDAVNLMLAFDTRAAANKLNAIVDPVITSDIKTIHRAIKLEAMTPEEQLASILSLNPVDVNLEDGERIPWQVENAGLESSLIDLEEKLKESAKKMTVSSGASEALVGVTVGITSGFLVWMLRGGALLASMFSISPLWRQLDPLPIVDAKVNHNEAEPENEDTTIESLFDASRR